MKGGGLVKGGDDEQLVGGPDGHTYRMAGSGRLPVLQHLADPPPVAMPPIVGQPLLMTVPFREVRVLEEQLRRPETSIPPTVPVSWVLPPLAKLLAHLLLAHPSSLSHSFLCIGRCVCYSSRSSPSLKKRDSSAPPRLQRYYGIKRPVLGASAKWAIIGRRLRVANFSERRTCELRRIRHPRNVLCYTRETSRALVSSIIREAMLGEERCT
jgi:hypothetical protein